MFIKLKALAEQVILITGASSGIGLVTAQAAAAKGAKVMLVARNEESLRHAVFKIEAAGGTASYAVADVGNMEDVQAAAGKTVELYGRIDTWISGAGTAIYGKLVDTPLDEHQQLFQTNYFGAVHSALTAVDHLRSKGGALIVIGSIASELPSPILSAYAASKHAVKGFVDSLRMELTADKLPISVTLIKPSGVDTPIAQHAANHVDGEALIPPLVYDPQLVADAILDAAVHVRREITVGGFGRLQVLLGVHFPRALDSFSGLLSAMMINPHAPKTATNSVFAPLQPGQERSGIQPGKTFTLYTSASRHPAAVVLASLALGGLAAAAVGRTALLGSKSHRRRRLGV